MTYRSSAYTVWLGSEISQFKCLQYDWDCTFPDKKNLSIDLLFNISQGPSMYPLSIVFPNVLLPYYYCLEKVGSNLLKCQLGGRGGGAYCIYWPFARTGFKNRIEYRFMKRHMLMLF